jgi:hypothetical protein
MNLSVLRFILVFGSLILIGIGIYIYIKVRPPPKKCCIIEK